MSYNFFKTIFEVRRHGGGKIKRKSIFYWLLLIGLIIFLNMSLASATISNDTVNVSYGTKNTTISSSVQTSDSKNSTSSSISSKSSSTTTQANISSTAGKAAGSPIQSKIKGAWVWSTALSSIDPWVMKKAGFTDIFVYTKQGTGEPLILNQFISKFKGTNIRVHAWIACFVYGTNPNGTAHWYPVNDPARQNAVRNVITYVINNCPGIAGIHLDYVRYGGTAPTWDAKNYPGFSTDQVTKFVSSVYSLVKNKNPNLLVSAAVMADCSENARLYGQDYSKLSLLDFMVPMIYKGSYGQSTAWIGTTTKWIRDHSSTAVISGIMSYRSETDETPLSIDELTSDVRAAIDNGSYGFVLFRYGLITSNFSATNAAMGITGTYTNVQVINAAKWVKNYIETNHKLPNTVYMSGNYVNMYKFLYLLSTVVQNIYNKCNDSVSVRTYNGPEVQKETINTGNMALSEYIHIADVVKVYMDKTGYVPGYAYGTSLGTYFGWKSMIYMYSSILSSNTTSLPSSVYVKPWRVLSDPNWATFTNIQVIDAASWMKSYIETNNQLPSTITVGSKQIGIYSFLYLLSYTVQNVYNHNTANVYTKSFKGPEVQKDTIHAGYMRLSEYIHIADVVKVYMDKTGYVPGYAYGTSLGTYFGWKSMIYMYSKILNAYKINKALPVAIYVKPII